MTWYSLLSLRDELRGTVIRWALSWSAGWPGRKRNILGPAPGRRRQWGLPSLCSFGPRRRNRFWMFEDWLLCCPLGSPAPACRSCQVWASRCPCSRECHWWVRSSSFNRWRFERQRLIVEMSTFVLLWIPAISSQLPCLRMSWSLLYSELLWYFSLPLGSSSKSKNSCP